MSTADRDMALEHSGALPHCRCGMATRLQHVPAEPRAQHGPMAPPRPGPPEARWGEPADAPAAPPGTHFCPPPHGARLLLGMRGAAAEASISSSGRRAPPEHPEPRCRHNARHSTARSVASAGDGARIIAPDASPDAPGAQAYTQSNACAAAAGPRCSRAPCSCVAGVSGRVPPPTRAAQPTPLGGSAHHPMGGYAHLLLLAAPPTP